MATWNFCRGFGTISSLWSRRWPSPPTTVLPAVLATLDRVDKIHYDLSFQMCCLWSLHVMFYAIKSYQVFIPLVVCLDIFCLDILIFIASLGEGWMKRVNKCLIAYRALFWSFTVNRFFEVFKRWIYERKMTMGMIIGAWIIGACLSTCRDIFSRSQGCVNINDWSRSIE